MRRAVIYPSVNICTLFPVAVSALAIPNNWSAVVVLSQALQVIAPEELIFTQRGCPANILAPDNVYVFIDPMAVEVPSLNVLLELTVLKPPKSVLSPDNPCGPGPPTAA